MLIPSPLCSVGDAGAVTQAWLPACYNYAVLIRSCVVAERAQDIPAIRYKG